MFHILKHIKEIKNGVLLAGHSRKGDEVIVFSPSPSPLSLTSTHIWNILTDIEGELIYEVMYVPLSSPVAHITLICLSLLCLIVVAIWSGEWASTTHRFTCGAWMMLPSRSWPPFSFGLLFLWDSQSSSGVLSVFSLFRATASLPQLRTPHPLLFLVCLPSCYFLHCNFSLLTHNWLIWWSLWGNCCCCYRHCCCCWLCCVPS